MICYLNFDNFRSPPPMTYMGMTMTTNQLSLPTTMVSRVTRCIKGAAILQDPFPWCHSLNQWWWKGRQTLHWKLW